MVMAVPVVGILLILGILLLFGVTWLFHHHSWKPVVGGLLFVVGVAALVIFGWVSERQMAVNPEFAPRSVGRDPDGGRSTIFAERTGSKASSDSATTADRSSSTPSTGSQPVAADARPAWVDRAPGLKSAGKGFEATVASEFYSTRLECKHAIVPKVNELVDEYISENFPDATEQGANLDRIYIWSKLVKSEYWETVDKSFGTETHPMNQLHVLLAFDSQVGRDLTELARQTLIGSRLKDAAGITACSLALMGGVYLLLKRGALPRTPTPE